MPISEAFFSWAVTRNVLGEMTHLTSDKLSSNASGCKLALAVERDKSFEARRIDKRHSSCNLTKQLS